MTATGAMMVISRLTEPIVRILKRKQIGRLRGERGKDPADQRSPGPWILTASASLALVFGFGGREGGKAKRRTGDESNHCRRRRPRRSTMGLATLGPLERKNGDRAPSPSNEMASLGQDSTCLMEP
ncbi:hypothetical protein BDV23DRAFT_59245 [Aspergillus alliaceus]|uniref:Uncharacterized protein n=1 Tax=Petromyces alliaceus TaxID=209559 RepID=A0A5N7CDR9_PETAA|nr:uncharacterized protein BDW43DRAFT_5110 [Aspergillus alliaceus]KAB8239453.1 hypothetical protein BDW43DRAFT_5110 [Aspergillus alliaceus]KAE8392007.1 hypothetical protein BDV23DRAFT_59245 [Aspergillus alliaceus]